MNVIIDIPMEPYLLCVAKVPMRSDEYLMLKNGIVFRDENGYQFVRIRSDAERARILRRVLTEHCPDMLDEVRETKDTSFSV
jgi:hypothetical protein